MDNRLQLQTQLENLLGSRNVYFQPPENEKLNYPCIKYKRNNNVMSFADNNPYTHEMQYQITVIDKNPDSLIPARIATMPKCKFDRYYAKDGLNHDVYNIFY
jgi:hypothetical protein